MISYYELLELVKENKAPKRIKVNLTSCSNREYLAEYDCDKFSHYYTIGNTDETYDYYLPNCFLESMMFDKCIEIIDDKPKKLEQIKWNEKSQYNSATYSTKQTITVLLSRSEQLKKNLNEIIAYLERKNNER